MYIFGVGDRTQGHVYVKYAVTELYIWPLFLLFKVNWVELFITSSGSSFIDYRLKLRGMDGFLIGIYRGPKSLSSGDHFILFFPSFPALTKGETPDECCWVCLLQRCKGLESKVDLEKWMSLGARFCGVYREG